ncbi:MAG: 4Fe-4S binding protein [Bryobacterales bacterium]|nr:4Fe-4S binding protein [Bryobacterales bacterium]
MAACVGVSRRLLLLGWLLAFVWSGVAAAQAIHYQRQADTAPQEKSIGGGYVTPPVQKPLPRRAWLQILDVALLAAALGAAVWMVLTKRSRRWIMALSAASLAYFGFYREGCVCPIGSIQNVTVALTDPSYRIPIVVIATFFLPLVVALFYGRAFCGGVCALGAIQEMVVIKPVQVPRRLDRALGLLKYAYLGAAIWFAVLPAAQRDFVICRFDPFVSMFRRTGFAHMLLIGGALLVVGLFVGRPYCRYLCPYGVLLKWCTRVARRGVTITPDKELDCGLCTDACPYGAIEKMRAVRPDCLYCARCYRACPRTLVQIGGQA